MSQMIHNPEVNKDLEDLGVQFIQDTEGLQLIEWEVIKPEDIVIIPAFGLTLETKEILDSIGVNTDAYNTTCPFVEKVWNRSAKLGETAHTIIIHGKHNHEETKATFSHSKQNAPSIIVRDMNETQLLGDYIAGKISTSRLLELFAGKYSPGFDPERDLQKIGVVNQTTMLASETQAIADYLKTCMSEKYGIENLKNHFADTRDTLCYATNDNQSATIALLGEDADLAIVVGGYNSSNTSHLVELLEEKFPVYFIKNKDEIVSANEVNAYDIHQKSVVKRDLFLPEKDKLKLIITSGASCPDATVDAVIQKILDLLHSPVKIENVTI